jgi:hypothetical protein
MLTVTETPNRTIDGYNSQCVGVQQTIYKFLRADYVLGSGNDSENTFTLDVAEGDKTAEFRAGDKIYIDVPNDLIDGIYTVVSSAFTTVTTVTIDREFTATWTGGICNNLTFYEGYIVYMIINYGTAGTKQAFGIPKSNGECILDISKLKIPAPGEMFTIQPFYYAAWKGGQETQQQVSEPTNIIAAFPRKGLVGGNNMWRAVQKLSFPNNGYFLTDLFPSDIDSKDYGSKWLGWSKKLYVLNQSIASINIFHYDYDANFDNRNTIETQPYTDNPAILESVQPEPAAGARYMSASSNGGASGTFSSSYFKVLPECKNPIMVEWANNQGGYDQWLFNTENFFSDNINEGYIFEQGEIIDWSIDVESLNRYANKPNQRATLRAANLKQYEIRGLHTIKESKEVRVWLTKDGSKHARAIALASYATEYTLGKQGFQFTLTIQFPDHFDFLAAKEY